MSVAECSGVRNDSLHGVRLILRLAKHTTAEQQ